MTPRTILVRGPNWVGDCVLSVPAIKAVRAHFPEAKITLLVRPWVAGLFHSATFIDNLWTQEKAKGIRNWIRTTREIKERHFDLAILLPNSFESALMVWTAGIPKRVGYQTDGRRLFLTNAVKPSSIKQHQYRYYLRLVTESFGPKAEDDLRIQSTMKEKENARKLLAQAGIRPEKSFMVVNPGAAFGGAKRWQEARFATVADKLAKELDFGVAIIGSESERAIGEKVYAHMETKAAVLSGKTSLETLVGLLSEASLIVTNDSGPMHIAAALGTPTVAVFGSTDSEVTSPVGPKTSVVRNPVDCSPCMLRECPIDHRCMEGVTVAKVYSSAMELINTIAETPKRA